MGAKAPNHKAVHQPSREADTSLFRRCLRFFKRKPPAVESVPPDPGQLADDFAMLVTVLNAMSREEMVRAVEAVWKDHDWLQYTDDRNRLAVTALCIMQRVRHGVSF